MAPFPLAPLADRQVDGNFEDGGAQVASPFKSDWKRSDPIGMGRFSAAAFWKPTRTDVRVVPGRGAPVEIQVIADKSLDVLNARNVSETGMGVYVPHGFEGFDLEEEVDFVITLPRELSFLTRGVIKHRTDGGREGRHFGLHFTQISREHRNKLRRYVAATAEG